MTRFPNSSSGWITHRGRTVEYHMADYRDRSKPRPPILVVVPCYNAQRWIEPCLAVLRANDEPHDVLIVEDGGTPLDLPIAGANIVHCRVRENIGLIGVLNFAARFCLEQEYKYYARQDADDFSLPTRLQKQRQKAEATGADLVSCGAILATEDDTYLWEDQGYLPSDIISALAYRNIFVHSTWFLQASTFSRIGCYDDRFIGAEDFELVQRIARKGRIFSVEEPLVTYRVHGGSILGNSNQPARTTVRVMVRYFSWRRPACYLGLMRGIAAALAPRGLKTTVRRLGLGLTKTT